MKRYKLLKDLPNIKAGAILEKTAGKYTTKDNHGHTAFLNTNLVENHPDWFKDVAPLEYKLCRVTASDETYCFEYRGNGLSYNSFKNLFEIIEILVEKPGVDLFTKDDMLSFGRFCIPSGYDYPYKDELPNQLFSAWKEFKKQSK